MDKEKEYMKLTKKELVKKVIEFQNKEERNKIFDNKLNQKIAELEKELKELRPLKKNVATQKAYDNLKNQKEQEISGLKARHALLIKNKDVLINKLTKTATDLINISRDGLDSVRISTNFVNNLLKNVAKEMYDYLPKPQNPGQRNPNQKGSD